MPHYAKINNRLGFVIGVAGDRQEMPMKTNLMIKDMPKGQRPYEKCAMYGPGVLTDAELLAVVIRTGTAESNSVRLAEEILAGGACGGGLLRLVRSPYRELMKIRGIGRVKAVQLKCVGEIARRISSENAKKGLSMNTPDSVAEFFMEDLRHKQHEEVVAAFFDTRARLISSRTISMGTVSASIISPREIFIEALHCEAANLILLHNHPSGDPSPSADDINMTKRISESGKLLGILVQDHIIIGDNCFCSLRKAGYI